MKVSKPVNWLSKALFQPQHLGNPIELEITEYNESQTSKGIDRNVLGKHKNGRIYQFSVFGDTLGQLIDGLGDDSDKWIGRRIQVMLVMRGDKELKHVRVMPLV